MKIKWEDELGRKMEIEAEAGEQNLISSVVADLHGSGVISRPMGHVPLRPMENPTSVPLLSQSNPSPIPLPSHDRPAPVPITVLPSAPGATERPRVAPAVDLPNAVKRKYRGRVWLWALLVGGALGLGLKAYQLQTQPEPKSTQVAPPGKFSPLLPVPEPPKK